MKILFLDQSGKPGGAELCLLDIARSYRDRCLVCLFADGSFRTMLEEEQIPVKVLATSIDVQKDSSTFQGIYSIAQLLPLAIEVARLSRQYDLIYANTQKALVVGALASVLSRRSLVFHLHDILSLEHFSRTNQRIAVTLANRFASVVIANSLASQSAFIAAGGQAKTQVVYNGFNLDGYRDVASQRQPTRQALGFTERDFVVGHFSRLAPWKGQHLLIAALNHCPESVSAILVGDALFGEGDYVTQIQQQVKDLNLEHRVRFVGFRSDVATLMAGCDLVAHTSTAPEPFGRVIVEAMLCGTPVVAAAAGGAMELVADGVTGWLVAPGDPVKLTAAIQRCYAQTELAQEIATTARIQASQRFDLVAIARQIDRILIQVVE